MVSPQSATDRLATLRAQIKELEQSALSELKEKRRALVEELAAVEGEIAALTGNRAKR